MFIEIGNCLFPHPQVEVNRNKVTLSEDWIPQEEIEANAYCRYPEP